MNDTPERADRGKDFMFCQQAVTRIPFRKRSHTFPSIFRFSDDSCDHSDDCDTSSIYDDHNNSNAFLTPPISNNKKNRQPESPRNDYKAGWGRSHMSSPYVDSHITHEPIVTYGNQHPPPGFGYMGSTMDTPSTPITPRALIPNVPSPLLAPYPFTGSLFSMHPQHMNLLSSPLYNRLLDVNNYGHTNADRIIEEVKKHRYAATHAEARHTWSGNLPTGNSQKTPVYSCKVFLGGVPWEMTDHDIKLTFSRFGNVSILRPGQHVKLSRSSQNKDKAGYLYLVFESDKQVKSLLSACIHDFSNGGKYYFALNQSRYRPKDIQIIPWNVNDTTFVKSPSARVDANKTVFVGALHGMLTAEGLAAILEDLFGGVVYVGIDTDKYKYPIGSGRVTFSTTKSYTKAVQAAFIDVKTPKFQKTIQIDPFLEESNCTHCRTEKGPIFCRDVCMTYLCRNCWDSTHRSETMRGHQPIMRTKSKI